MSRETRLVELRTKTDRDLLILVQRELDRGLALVDVAVTKRSPLYAHAYETVKALLPKLSGLGKDERNDLELRHKELRTALDRPLSQRYQHYLASTVAE
jgi:hypothetical protein